MNLIKKIVVNVANYFENENHSFFQALWTFFFAVTLRNFIELFSDLTPQTPFIYLHYYTSYLALALTFTLIFYWCTKMPIIKITKLILSLFIIVILAPIIDLVISCGKGFDMSYFMPGTHTNMLERYFTFFGSLEPSAFTIGMRIEIAIILILSFFYFLIKTNKLIRSLFFTILLYTSIFLFGSLPFFIKPALAVFGLKFWPVDHILSYIPSPK